MQNPSTNMWDGAGTNYLVETAAGKLYLIFIDVTVDVTFITSDDYGRTWSEKTILKTGTITVLSVWYDRWSGINGGLIHCAYSEAGVDDTLYRSIDSEDSDALSAETVIFGGASTVVNGSMLSITRSRGGNLYCRTCIDAGAEGGFFRSTDVGATWASRTINEALATTDQMILLPGFAVDDQDIIGIFWDASDDEISRQLYDDSGDSWAETSIATSMVDNPAGGGQFPHFAAAIDLDNSQVVLTAWTAVDLANADLRCWTVNESAITEVTNVVLNSGDDQGLCTVRVDPVTGYWHVSYAGASDGSETWFTGLKVYEKVSRDAGTTWGAESARTVNARIIYYLLGIPRGHSRTLILGESLPGAGAVILVAVIPVATARAQSLVGV